MNNPKITKIEIHQFEWESENLGLDYNQFNLVYTPGARMTHTSHILQIHTDAGITGEYLCGSNAEFAQMEMYTHYLLGRYPLKREQFYNEVKRALRKFDRMSMGMVDIVLWDIAGKLYNAPVWELLGGFRHCCGTNYHLGYE